MAEIHGKTCGCQECTLDRAFNCDQKQKAEIERLQKWVNDLQSGMYINCVYCGHRYGPKENTPVTMAEVLKQHIEKCPEHPMSQLKACLDEIEKVACGEEQIESDGGYNDTDGLKWIYDRIQKYKAAVS